MFHNLLTNSNASIPELSSIIWVNIYYTLPRMPCVRTGILACFFQNPRSLTPRLTDSRFLSFLKPRGHLVVTWKKNLRRSERMIFKCLEFQFYKKTNIACFLKSKNKCSNLPGRFCMLEGRIWVDFYSICSFLLWNAVCFTNMSDWKKISS